MAYEPMSPMSTRRLTNRNTNRYSVTALFSMAAEQDVEVEDDLAKGPLPTNSVHPARLISLLDSPETTARSQGKDFRPVEKELRVGTRCTIPGFSDCLVDSEQNGARRGMPT